MTYQERTVINRRNQIKLTSSQGRGTQAESKLGKRTQAMPGYGKRKKAIQEDVVLIAVAFVIAVVMFIVTSITVNSRTKGATLDNAAYYHQLEEEYVKEARKIMNGQGYFDAGISMTRRMNEAGERIYTVKVHHNRLMDGPSDKADELMELLANIPFEDGQVLYQII